MIMPAAGAGNVTLRGAFATAAQRSTQVILVPELRLTEAPPSEWVQLLVSNESSSCHVDEPASIFERLGLSYYSYYRS